MSSLPPRSRGSHGPSAQAGVRFGDFSANASAALVVPIDDVGPSLYDDFSDRGLEGRLVLDYHLWRWLGVQLSAALTRLDFDLTSPARGSKLDDDTAPSSVSLSSTSTPAPS